MYEVTIFYTINLLYFILESSTSSLADLLIDNKDTHLGFSILAISTYI